VPARSANGATGARSAQGATGARSAQGATGARSAQGATGARSAQGATGGSLVTVGVLALQGGFAAHRRMLRALGADVREVRVPADLDGLDGLVIPGGESTTMTLGIEREGLAEPLRELAASRRPILGTCAGLIMLDRAHLGLMDVEARRNAFGRQVRSFEADLEIAGLDGPPLRAVFIRAPWIASHGDGVEILATLEGHPIAARQGNLLAVAFHPELGGDTRLHEQFLAACRVGASH
jgi:5'-phosphate synthase pdxT subunit